ncbi:hypothetical protein BD769DRAFT_1392873 [Suillus cothurnatus]|nr:hypothetical protein BD769DRAFT_1392873 [Suillus cothurnatus]
MLSIHSSLLSQNTVNKSSLNADATRRRAPKIEGPRRIPQGFFDNSSPPRGPNTAAPRQSHNPLSWAQNLISGMLRRRDGSNVRLPAIVEVPLTAGKPRNYHARKKPSASSSQPTKPPTTQQQSGGATQSNPSSSQQPPATATASTTPPAVTSTTGVAGTRHDITIRQAGWRARFLLWVVNIREAMLLFATFGAPRSQAIVVVYVTSEVLKVVVGNATRKVGLITRVGAGYFIFIEPKGIRCCSVIDHIQIGVTRANSE